MTRIPIQLRPGGSRRLALVPLLVLGAVLPAAAADWPQWRGPQRTGISAEKGWLSRWPGAGPKQLWTANVGEGFSAVSVRGNRLYTLGNANGQDTVYCLDANTGRPVWKYSYACAAGDYGGPRAAPTLDGNVVYTLSREGHALCLDAATGRRIWGKDLRRETGAAVPRWGFAGSPLVHEGRVLYNVGTAGIALDGRGSVLWKSGGGTAGYSSPLPFTAGTQKGVALFTAEGLVAVNPANGRRLWSFPWQTSYDVNAADPIFSGGSVFISSNYEKGGALLNLAGGRPKPVWQNRNMRNHFNSCVLVAGALFGNDQNTLKCIDWKTGQERWRERGMGKGGLISADGKLIVLTERGELLVVQATPQKYTELARARLGRGTYWTSPTLANGRIYARSHQGVVTCVDVRGK
ncbi:MAG: PQQ-binding-like beta-propeller repeat protein [Armatimonadota bacterium]